MYTTKSTPDQIMLYQMSLELHRNLNNFFMNPSTQLVGIVNQIVCTGRQNYFEFYRTNRTKIGLNAIENKFYHINKQIPLDTMNFTYVYYKKLVKILFLKYGKT